VPTSNVNASNNNTLNTPVPAATTPGTAATPKPTPTIPQYVPPPRIEDFDEKNDIKDIEFYQPVTVVVLSNNYEILQSLPRAVRPPDVVEKYMNEVFDTCKRAEETFLAFRLPKEGAVDGSDGLDRSVGESGIGGATNGVSTPTADGTGAPPAEKRRATANRSRSSIVA
jgi:hypothetical protein